MKKLYGLLAAVLILMLCCAAAFAAESGTFGDGFTWSLSDDGVMTINGSGAIPANYSDVTEWDREQVTRLVVGEGITSIGEFAFWNHQNLTSVSLPSSLKGIESCAFMDCEALLSVTFPEGLETIGEYAFSGCVALESISFPSTLTLIGNKAFEWCERLTSVSIPQGTNLSSNAFFGCRGLANADGMIIVGNSLHGYIGNASTVAVPVGVTAIGANAFENSDTLITVTIPGTVTEIGNEAFTVCESLTSVTIPSSVTVIGSGLFDDYCSPTISCYMGSYAETYALENGIPVNYLDAVTGTCGEDLEWRLEGDVLVITGTGAMYDGEPWAECAGQIVFVQLSDSVTSIGANAFAGCSALSAITVRDGVTAIGENAFAGCTALTITCFEGSAIDQYAQAQNPPIPVRYIPTSGEVGEGLAWRFFGGTLTISGEGAISDMWDGHPWASVKNNVTHLVIEDGVTNIGENAFYMHPALTSAVIPGSVDTIGTTAFGDCYRLTSVTIGDGVTNIGLNAFCGSGLTSITVPESVSIIQLSAFADCRDLTSYTIADSTKIIDGAFANCMGLANEDGLIIVRTVLHGSVEEITDVTIPNYITSIGPAAFQRRAGLTHITIPGSVATIGSWAFEYCDNLTTATIPASVTFIGDRAFVDPNADRDPYDEDEPGEGASLTIRCYRGSAADTFAQENNINVEYLDSIDGVFGDDLTWSLQGDVLVIAGEGAMDATQPWAEYAGTIVYVQIRDGVTDIGANAFSGCSALKLVSIPDSVTAIGANAFAGCSALPALTVKDSVTAIGANAFAGCSALTITCFEGSAVDLYALAQNPPIPVDYFPVTGTWGGNITWAFSNGTLTITGSGLMMSDDVGYPWETLAGSVRTVIVGEGVTGLSRGAFYEFNRLTQVSLPSSLTSIGEAAFSWCSSLTSVAIPYGVTYIDPRAFGGTGLTNVVLPDSVQAIDWMAFADCTALETVTIPNSVEYIGFLAFGGCPNLTICCHPGSAADLYAQENEIPVRYLDAPIEGVCGEDLTWSLCGGTLTISGSGDMEDYYYTEDIPWAQYLNRITAVVIGDGVERIGRGAFSGCASLTSVSIPQSVTSFGAWAFMNCSGLVTVTIPENVTSIEASTFEGCTSLTAVTFPKRLGFINADAFDGCDSVTFFCYKGSTADEFAAAHNIPVVYLPVEIIPSGTCGEDLTWTYADGVLTISGTGAMDNFNWDAQPWESMSGLITAVVLEDGVTTIGEFAFYEHQYLTSVSLPASLTAIGNAAFHECSALTAVTLPDGLSTIGGSAFSYTGLTSIVLPDSVTSIGAFAFSSCNALTGITFPEHAPALGQGVFYECNALTAVTLPDDLTVIGEELFSCCRNLASVNIPAGVTEIGDAAFYSCALTSVVLPDGVTTIGRHAFYGCRALTSINIPDSVTEIGGSAFSGCWGLADDQGVIIVKNVLYDCKSDATAVVIPDGVTAIGSYAFGDCMDLLSVTIPRSVTEIGEMAFDGCDNVTICCYRNSAADAYAQANGIPVRYLETISGTCGEGLTWTLTSDGVLTISGNGWMDSFDEENRPWNDYTSEIFSLVIEDGVQTIGSYAFTGCTNLTSASFPRKLYWIAEDAFDGCDRVTFYCYEASCADNYAMEHDPQIPVVYLPYTPPTSGSCGENLTWSLADGVLTITGSGAMDNFYGCQPWEDSVTQITRVELPDGLTYIGESAFSTFTSLTEITIPATVTGMGNAAFGGSGLTSVTIPGSMAGVGSEAFVSCESLTTVTIEEGVGAIHSSAFMDCYNLSSVSIPAGVTVIEEYAFMNCENLTSITIPDSVTVVGECAFAGCTSLTELTLPDGADLGDRAFYQCWGLANDAGLIILHDTLYGCKKDVTAVTIPGNITRIGSWTFDGCENLSAITIPDTVTQIGFGAFDGCSSLGSVTIPNGVTSIERWTFNNCTSLSAIAIPSSVTRIDTEAFNRCTSLTTISIPNSITYIGSWAFCGCTSLTSIVIPESVTTIGECAFDGCNNLTIRCVAGSAADEYARANGIPVEYLQVYSGTCGEFMTWRLFGGTLTISGEGYMDDCTRGAPWAAYLDQITTVILEEGVESIGYCAFKGCSAMTSVSLPESLRYIPEEAFKNCSALTSVVIPTNVNSIDGWAFEGCTSLRTVTFPKRLRLINEYAFEGCSGMTFYCYKGSHVDRFAAEHEIPVVYLEDHIVPSGTCGENLTWTYADGVLTISGTGEMDDFDWDAQPWESASFQLTSVIVEDGVTGIGAYAFYNFNALTSVTLADSVTAIRNYAFYYCGLSAIDLPEALTSIGNSAFSGCSGLTTLSLPDTLTSIGNFAFAYCSRLTDFAIPAGVTHIGGGAFENCGGLKTVVLPEGLTAIESTTFYYCWQLTDVTIPRSVTTISDSAFAECDHLTIHCYRNSAADAYALANGIPVVYIADPIDDPFPTDPSLRKLSLPAQLTAIEAEAFLGSAADVVVLPAGTETIGSKAFGSMTRLIAIRVPSAVTAIAGDAFAGSDRVVLYVAEGSYAHSWAIAHGLPFGLE